MMLPEAAEPFIPEGKDLSALHHPGVYALRLDRPEDMASAWDDVFDVRPDYWDDLNDRDGVVYVGAAEDILYRLEEHVRGHKRRAALLRVCGIDGLRNIWWCDSPSIAFTRESQLATMLQNEYPDLYVHSR